MPVFHVELSEGVPVECRPPLLRRCFALHAAMGSIVRDGQVDSQEFACLFSAALGSSLPSSIGVPKPSQCNTAPDWIAYGDWWSAGRSYRGGKGYDFFDGKTHANSMERHLGTSPPSRRGRRGRPLSRSRRQWLIC